jgi:hypothetical protein
VLKLLLWLGILGAVAFVGATVPLGKHTLFGHVRAIWATPEAREMRDGIKHETAPVVDKVKRGVEAGIREVSRRPPEAESESPIDAGSR